MSALASLRLHAVPPAELQGVWRGDQLAQQTRLTIASGHEPLDHELPGQGWPLSQLTEILQNQAGLHEWRLLLPALRLALANGPLVLIGAPHAPNLSALAAAGIAADKVLCVDAHTPAERLWATEQTLRCKELGALLAWLPQARSEQLRRLQLASTSSRALAFVLRPAHAMHESSPAPLRVCVQTGEGLGLSVQILKRRGPLIDHPITLSALLPVMAALRKQRGNTQDHDHAVDRTANIRIERRPRPRLHVAA